ncbi:putative tripeptidyl-peptidase I [Lanmaoa asiatica]|nr:putative tripeptidyl-peptidase I [Lanmaoa asiatica]
MRSFLLPFVLLSLGLVASSDPILSRWALHERRSHIPSGWNLARRYDASAVIPLRFALAQSNIENLEEYLWDVSHPSSPNYGKHWSADRVASTFAPSRQSVDVVRDWLLESGIEAHRIKLSASGGWLEFKATTREAEDLLHASYNVYGHETGVQHVACESYHLPEHVVRHVDFVTPTVHFDAKLSKRSGSGQPLRTVGLPGSSTGPKTTGELLDWTNLNQLVDCDTHITPLCLRALYGLLYEPVVPERIVTRVVEYTPQSFRQDDLNMFARNFSSDLYGISPVMKSIDGGMYTGSTCWLKPNELTYTSSAALSSQEGFDINGESNLDLEYAMNLVTSKQNITLYQVGDLIEGLNSDRITPLMSDLEWASTGGSFNNFLDALDGSYCTFEGGDDTSQDGVYPDPRPGGYAGSEDCGTVKPANVISTSYGYNEADLTIAYASRQCDEYGKLGLMGVTFLDAICGWQDFQPYFPSTCPYVTAIGATQLSPGKTVFDSEDACSEVIYSGGGFSNFFAIPDYQKNVVSSYLKNTPPAYPSSIWNSTGNSRAYPDISANGANYVVAVNGRYSRLYGTSAASPVVGAILTMVNDARIALNKSPIGFINPLIYAASFSDAFNDITNGTNSGCGTLGFNTSEGWDPVTGLGTPNFPKLLAKWIALP